MNTELQIVTVDINTRSKGYQKAKRFADSSLFLITLMPWVFLAPTDADLSPLGENVTCHPLSELPEFYAESMEGREEKIAAAEVVRKRKAAEAAAARRIKTVVSKIDGMNNLNMTDEQISGVLEGQNIDSDLIDQALDFIEKRDAAADADEDEVDEDEVDEDE